MSTYDTRDIVRQHALLRAGPLKLAVYSVRDPLTAQFSLPVFHFTYDNTVLATLHQHDATALATFIRRVEDGQQDLPAHRKEPGDLWLHAYHPRGLEGECAIQFQVRRGAYVLAVIDGQATAKMFARFVESTLAQWPRPDEPWTPAQTGGYVRGKEWNARPNTGLLPPMQEQGVTAPRGDLTSGGGDINAGALG